MMSAEQNDFITRVGADRPAGRLLRRYWQPAALLEEFSGPHPVRPVRLLGQDLVLFRDEEGNFGLIDRDCPHRGADLAFGRPEDGGIRCPFHGWLFDTKGNCIETPAEPEGSQLCKRIKQRAYPVEVRNGIIFGYLGEGEPPAFPALDCFVAPETHVFAFKGLIECNWLQALEVGMDPAHASFLHRFFEDDEEDEAYGRQFRANSAESDMPMTKVLRDFPRPEILVDTTDYGLQLTALRKLSEAMTHVRVTNVLFPQAFVIPLSSEMTITQWHVPVDDTSCYWYAMFTSFTAPVEKERMREQRLTLYELPDYRPRVGQVNNYGFDPIEQVKRTYTGMGEDINVHDQWAVESQGRIQNRTREHLGQTDKGIIAFRRMLVAAINATAQNEAALMVLDNEQAATVRGPSTVDGICPTDKWEEAWARLDAERRGKAAWLTASGAI